MMYEDLETIEDEYDRLIGPPPHAWQFVYDEPEPEQVTPKIPQRRGIDEFAYQPIHHFQKRSCKPKLLAWLAEHGPATTAECEDALQCGGRIVANALADLRRHGRIGAHIECRSERTGQVRTAHWYIPNRRG